MVIKVSLSKGNTRSKRPTLNSAKSCSRKGKRQSVLICICSKYQNPLLYECIKKLYEKQVHNPLNAKYIYKIHVVDSCSSNIVNYHKIALDFPEVKIHMIENKNYEYGAWKYILKKYPSQHIYFCIQDTIIINRYIDLDILDNKTAYTFHHKSGYLLDPNIKEMGIENLKNSNLNYKSIIDTKFNLAQHNSFIVNRHMFQDIFKHLTIAPINKLGSRFYERNFGIYFLAKGINTVDLFNFMSKTHGERI